MAFSFPTTKTVPINHNETLVKTAQLLLSNKPAPIRLLLTTASTNEDVDHVSLEEFIHALETTKTCIPDVVVDPRGLDAVVNSDTRMRLSNAIGSNPALKALSWRSGPTQSSARSMQHLTVMLLQARRVKNLSCVDVTFDGTATDYQNFASALANHPTLEEVWIKGCTVADNQTTASHQDCVLASLSTLQSLRDLSMSCFASPGSVKKMENSSLLRLGRLPNLTTLDFTGIHKLGVVAAATALRESRSIKNLYIKASLCAEDFTHLSDIVRTNQVLEGLHIWLGPVQNDHPVSLLLNALKENTTLASLEFMFQQRDRFFSSSIQQAIIAMLEHFNFTLLVLSFDLSRSLEVRNHHTESLVDYYLSLNRLGRAMLLTQSNLPKEDWIAVLNASIDNVDPLYYFLSRNPTLFT